MRRNNVGIIIVDINVLSVFNEIGSKDVQADVTSSGRLFQIRGPAAVANEPLPRVARRDFV